MLNEKTLQKLTEIKKLIRESGYWSKSLSGACNVSSIIVQSILDSARIESYIVNNHKHCFNIIPTEEDDYVVDLTACQISNDSFPQEVVIDTWTNMNDTANSIIRGKGFYALSQTEDYFFAKGGLTDILKVNPDFENDHNSLYRILKRTCELLDIETGDISERTPDNVNIFAINVINSMAEKHAA